MLTRRKLALLRGGAMGKEAVLSKIDYYSRFAAYGAPSEQKWAKRKIKAYYDVDWKKAFGEEIHGKEFPRTYKAWEQKVEQMKIPPWEKEEKEKAQKRARIGARGRSRTILTGGRGIAETPILLRKRLLGQ